MAYIILHNLQNMNSQILPTKTPRHILATLSLIINKKKSKRKREKKNSKHLCKCLIGILVGLPFRSYLKYEIDYRSDKISFLSTKQEK